MGPRYLVGIDLGTTNTACAYVDTTQGRGIEIFDVPQLTRLGTVEPRSTLPSFLYLAGEHDVPPGSLALPWDAERQFCVGWLAREQGAKVPGRLVTSSKSWICHGGVDRGAAILPWGGAEDVQKISPVEASARTIAHLREAWDATFDAPLAEQDIVLTVPASFDAVARELTLRAATQAGLERLHMLEEPQAAFYAWLASHEDSWRERVREHPLILVVDVGGGTSDFSLVAADFGRGELSLARVAVGDHLLLGGDNMDLALAQRIEAGLGGGRLDASRFHLLVAQCRAAKESMLADPTIDDVAVSVPGRGGKVIGGTRSARLSRTVVTETVLEGFFPVVAADAQVEASGTTAGTGEFGLPYTADTGVTRHIADFLRRQHEVESAGSSVVRPDAILFNGGTCEPAPVRERIADTIGRWHAPDGSWRPSILESESLQLAVARGAAYYGMARRGDGVRIGSGTARTYYLGLDDESERVLCVVPRGMDEGERCEIERDFELVTNRAVSFALFTATDRVGEAAGDVIEVDRETLTPLAPIRAVLRFGRKLEERVLPVRVEPALSDVGTLELWCASRDTEHRWRLEFRLRPDVGRGAVESAGLVIAPERLDAAGAALAEVFERDHDPVPLIRALEAALDAERAAWPLAAIRILWDRLWSLEAGRRRSERHEARWLNLAGYLLRPGFGAEDDELRVAKLWRVLGADLAFPRATQGRAERWNLWKRVAGGLDQRQQEQLLRQVTPPLLKRGKAKGPKPGPQEMREMWQAIGSCERIPAAVRGDLAMVAARSAARGKASAQELWALGRLAARAPIYGPLNCVVARADAEAIAETLLGAKSWPRPDAYAFTLAQIARRTGDRERDLDAELAERVATMLEARGESPRAARLVREVVELESQEQARVLDESLPAGLRLAG